VTTSAAAGNRPALPLADACCAAAARAGHRQPGQRHCRAAQGPGRPHPARLVSLVAAHDGGEACVCDLTEPLGLTQPTISHHLKILVDAGIFTRDKRGVWAYYSLVSAALDALSAVLRSAR
jgi:ArsR family transcriptional regulator